MNPTGVVIGLVILALAFGVTMLARGCQGDEYGSCSDWNSWSGAHHVTYAAEHFHGPGWISDTDAYCGINPDAASFLNP